MKDLKHIHYKYESDERFVPMNNIQILFEMEDECLLFNQNFHTVDINDFDLSKWQSFIPVPTPEKTLWERGKSKLFQRTISTNELNIGRIVEIKIRIDEPQALIKLSNKAILHIYQCIEGYGTLNQHLRYIAPNETQAYNEAIDSMNTFNDEDLDLVYRENGYLG